MTRYVGNTGRYYRVNDLADDLVNGAGAPAAAETVAAPTFGGNSGGGLFGGLFGGLGGINLPFGLEFADLALLVLFVFLYLESGDWEFLIIAAFLGISAFSKG